MTILSFTIACDNDAFADGRMLPEVKRILKWVMWRVHQSIQHETTETVMLTDANGNTVGSFMMNFENEPAVDLLKAVRTPIHEGTFQFPITESRPMQIREMDEGEALTMREGRINRPGTLVGHTAEGREVRSWPRAEPEFGREEYPKPEVTSDTEVDIQKEMMTGNHRPPVEPDIQARTARGNHGPIPPMPAVPNRTYPAKRKGKKAKSRYLDPDAPLDTPALDDSFHKGEMDV